MTSLIAFIASYVVSAACQIPLLCVAGWLTARLLRVLGPAVQHRLWMTVLMLSVVTPALPAPQRHGMGVSVTFGAVHVHTASYTSIGPAFAWSLPVWLPTWLLEFIATTWTLTVLYGASRLLYAFCITRRLVDTSEPCDLSADLNAALHCCATAFCITDVHVRLSHHLASPVTLRHGGRDLLLLPARMQADVSQPDLLAAVAHECAHMQRRDYTMHLLLQIAALPVRFHPVTQRVLNQIAAKREIACDAAAHSLQGPEYRDALLRLAHWIASVPPTHSPMAMGFAVGIFDSNSLEERMKQLATPRIHVRRPVVAALLVIAVLSMVGTAGALSLHGVHLQAATPSGATISPQTASEAPRDPQAPAASASRQKRPAHLIQPKLIYQVDPEFPANASKQPGARKSLISLTVDAEGKPQNVHVRASGGKDFDAEAIKAVRQYRFRPAMDDDKPVVVDLTVAVNFERF